MSSSLDPVKDASLTSQSCIRHAFFTRQGGHSQGIYKSLNTGLGSEDDRQAVTANRTLCAAYLKVEPATLFTPYQIHSSDVVVTGGEFEKNRPEADGIVTATPGLGIGIQTADCGPILFCDPKAKVIGAAHAGWKGATGGVLENTISKMEELGASRKSITAVLGPMISQENYEVGPEFVERLKNMDIENSEYLLPSGKNGHCLFDLAAYIVDRLDKAGVSAHWTGHCTYADEQRFYSYRRKTHLNEPDYGRQLSAICLT